MKNERIESILKDLENHTKLLDDSFRAIEDLDTRFRRVIDQHNNVVKKHIYLTNLLKEELNEREGQTD